MKPHAFHSIARTLIGAAISLSITVMSAVQQAGERTARVSFEQGEGNLRISIGGRPVAEYVFNDDQVRRPYFRHLRTPSGIQVTVQSTRP